MPPRIASSIARRRSATTSCSSSSLICSLARTISEGAQ
jgi:hypothetical protein